MNIKALEAPDYTDEELSQLVTDLLVLTKAQIEDFLGQNDLRRSSTKAEKRERIEEALNDGDLAPERIIQFLDAVIPWGKQHVYGQASRLRIGRSRAGSSTTSNSTGSESISMPHFHSHCPKK